METLNARERLIRQAVRNFLVAATLPELRRELEICLEQGDDLRARFVRELIDEATADAAAIDDALHGDRWEATGN